MTTLFAIGGGIILWLAAVRCVLALCGAAARADKAVGRWVA